MAINASSGGQLQGGTGSGGGLTEEDVQDIVADQIEVGNDINIGLQATYDDSTGKLVLSLAGATNGGGSGSGVIVKENDTARGSATTLNFVGPNVSVADNVATITGGLDSISVYENTQNRGNFTSINFVSGATVTVNDGTANVTISGGSGGGSYTLPTASTSVLGGVKVDGTTITIDSNGVITAVGGGSGGGISLGDVGTYLTNNGYATQTYVTGQVTNLINGAPAILDTLNELQAALGGDANFASTITTALTGKLNISGGTMTGTLTLAGSPVNALEAATKAYVDNKVSTGLSSLPTPASYLDDLVDVDTSSGVSTGQLLGWDGTKWTATNNAGLQGPQGPAGATGPAGANGSSITSATVSVAGRLLVTLSNGTVVDAGNVSGITSATVDSSGDLILTKQDSSTVNAGNVVGPQGATGATGPQGPQGSTGSTGVGVAGAAVNGSGQLVITLTDGSTVNAGSSVGPQGPQGVAGPTGPTGPQGVSVATAVIDGSGNLILTLDDGTSIQAGSSVGPQGPQGVQGPAGRSIADSGVAVDGAGNLQITLSDGVVINAGYVVGPQGSTGSQGIQGIQGIQGATGAQGPQGDSYTVNGTTGSVQIYGLSSTTQAGYDFEVDVSNKANRLTTARTISLAGKVTGLTSFDGTGNVSITTALSGVTTSDVNEGTNQYFTQARARSALSSTADSSISSLISYDDSTGVIKYRASTSYITEGSNLYFTNSRADARADARIGAASINALADVDTVTTAPTNGQVLTWTGSAWTPAAAGSGSGAVSSVNTKTGAVVLSTDDIAEGTSNLYYTNSRFDTRLATKTTDNLNEGTTNKYFSNTLARNALAAGTGISYNSSTGTITLSANTDQVTEGSSNLFYTNARFDTRFGQSSLNQLSDVADITPTTGQALAWNGSAWTPTTISGGGGGGGTSSGVFRASAQVEYDPSGNLSSVSVLSGGIAAVIATATSTTATVTFTFTGSTCPPLSTMVYGYQRASNVFVSRALASDFTTRTIAGGGTSGSPTAFSSFDPSTNTMTLSLTKALTGASAAVGQTTHAVVQFLLSSE
jgi:hypothetical protein